MRLFNQYRLLLLAALAAVYYLAFEQHTLGQRHAALFEISHLGFVVTTLVFVYLTRNKRPSVAVQFFLQNYLDILFIGLLMYSSGGVQSGLGVLMLINIALLSQLTGARHAMLFAAIATTIVLSEELFANLMFGRWAADFEQTAFLGLLMFVVSWFLTVPLRRLAHRQVSVASANRAALDVKEIADLNEEIIRELDSGVVVIDSANQVMLINDTARTLLSAEFSPLPMHLKRLCGSLMRSLEDAKKHQNFAAKAITIESTGLDVLPQFIPLSSGGVLIKLDDYAAINQQYQQLKLASLGKLSASIAHEIRNPLSAISHAVQLLEESPELGKDDHGLLKIAGKHANRINRIVEDVMQLSNGQRIRQDSIDLSGFVNEFCDRFESEKHGENFTLDRAIEDSVVGMFDPEHLDQVLWNLCSNSLLHNEGESIALRVECWHSGNGYAVIDVTDDGKGISDIDQVKLFEPFYSTHQNGSGLGLYIIKELCELNKASLESLPADTGAHFRITLATSAQMAA